MSRGRIKILLAAALAAVTSMFGVLLSTHDTFASEIDDAKSKYLARAFIVCYGNMTKQNINPQKFVRWSDIILNDSEIVGLYPDYIQGKNELSCSDLFMHLGVPAPPDSASSSVVNADSSKTIPILTKLGFVEDKNSAEQCKDYNFGEVDKGTNSIQQPYVTVQVCANVADGKIDGELRQNRGYRKWVDRDEPVGFTQNDDGKMVIYASHKNELELDVQYPQSGSSWSDFTNKLDQALSKYKYSNDADVNWLDYLFYVNMTSPKAGSSGGTADYRLDTDPSSPKLSYKVAYTGLVGPWPSDIKVSNDVKAALYQDFLVTHFGLEATGCVSSGEPKGDGLGLATSDDDLEGWRKGKIYNADGKKQTCYVRATKNFDDKIYGIAGSGAPAMVSDGAIGLRELLDFMNNGAPNSISSSLASSIGQPAEPGKAGEDSEPEKEKEDEDEGSESCFDGAGALGWVLCPILEGTSWAVNQLYSGFIEPALTINADLLTFDSNGDKGAYATWQTFQTFANIAFVIMILVVIFSQLTGVGIDNYGIKRILPRLIIAAILINLSFIICQLLVDLSNILGVSLKNLFDNLGPDYKAVGGSTGGAIFVDILIGVVAVGGAFLALGLGVLIPVIVAAISALIAIFFLFLVLAGRQAAVVILVVISPIALVMYMLPNTKKYFDKFVKIFVTLLVVFPVCGLLMGGGDFASRVLLQAGQASANSFSSTGEGFFYQISAVLVSIVPFFFIPSLVKGSLAGLGNIGSKISGIGSKVGGKASGQARSTLGNTRLGDPSRFKRWSNVRRAERRDSAEREANLRRAQSRVKRLNARRENGKVLDEADVRRLAVAQATVDKYGGEDLAARTSLAMLDYGNSSEKDIREAWRKAFKAGDGNQLRAVTNVMQSRFGSNAAKFIGDDLEGLESEGIDIANNANAQASMKALQDHANNDSKFAGDLKAKAYDAQAMIASGGVTKEWKDADGTVHKEYGNLSHFTAGGGGAKLDTIEDISTQGTGAIRRAVAAGAITAEQATSVLSSSDQRIQSGIASDAGKRDELMNATFADGSTVADHVKKAQADQAREAKNEKLEQEEKELQVQHHEDAMAIGQKPITVGSISFDGYGTPAGFTPAGDPVQDADGHWIYTDKTNGRTWDATTGRYGKPIQGPFPKP